VKQGKTRHPTKGQNIWTSKWINDGS